MSRAFYRYDADNANAPFVQQGATLFCEFKFNTSSEHSNQRVHGSASHNEERSLGWTRSTI